MTKIKLLLSLAMLLCLNISMMAALPQNDEVLPLDPKVRHGVLPNGLNYYVVHNEEPISTSCKRLVQFLKRTTSKVLLTSLSTWHSTALLTSPARTCSITFKTKASSLAVISMPLPVSTKQSTMCPT